MDPITTQPQTQFSNQSTGKGKIISYVIIFLLVAGGIYWAVSMKGEKVFADQINGKVVSVKGDTFVVDGFLNIPEARNKQVVTIEFTVNSETKYTKNALMLRSDLPAGQSYTPETVKSGGSLSDLKKNVVINKVLGNKNLFGATKAVAKEVEYSIMVIPQPSGATSSSTKNR